MLLVKFCIYLAILLSGSIFGVVNYKKSTTLFKILTLFLSYTLALFLQMLETPTETAIFRQNIFWLNICVLFYTIAIMASFSIVGYMAKHHIDNEPVSRITEFVTYLNYAVLGYTVVADKKQSVNNMAHQTF